MKFLYINLYAMLFAAIPLAAQTTVGSSIYTNTTFTKANSPYIITSDITIFQGVTLTIEPGVTLLFDTQKQITLRGRLIAEGTLTDSIIFNVNGSSNVKYKGFLIQENNSKYINQLSLEYCRVENASRFISIGLYLPKGKFNIKKCCFNNNIEVFTDIPYYIDSVSFDSCSFHNNALCIEGLSEYKPVLITDCIFTNNKTACEGGIIERCTFIGNTTLGARLRSSIKNSLFYNNEVAIAAHQYKNAAIENNEVIYNNIGIDVLTWRDDAYKNLSIKNNKICHNKTWNIDYHFFPNITINNNCWCTNDSIKIRATIKDGYIDPSRGLISFTYNDTCSSSMPDPDTPTYINVVNKNRFVIYPNPTYQSANVEFDYYEAQQCRIIITNLTGQIVQHINPIHNKKAIIEKGDKSPGIYFVQLFSENGILATEKLVIQ